MRGGFVREEAKQVPDKDSANITPRLAKTTNNTKKSTTNLPQAPRISRDQKFYTSTEILCEGARGRAWNVVF